MKAVVFKGVGDIRLEDVREPKTLRIGNCHHRKHIPRLLDLIVAGTVKPERVLSQHEPMTAAIEAYRAFDLRRPGWLKVELSPEVH